MVKLCGRSLLIAHRSFSVSLRSFANFYARTSLNPSEIKFIPPEHFQSKSLFVLSTPSMLPRIMGKIIDLNQRNDIQVIVAGIDSVVPNSQRNGVSELWLGDTIKVEKSTLLDVNDDINRPPKESNGVNIVVARKNWKFIESGLEININKNTNIQLELANTVFSNGNLVTLFYLQRKEDHDNNSGQTLCELSISFPAHAFENAEQIQVQDKWTPLYDTKEKLIVTDCIGNLLKSINSKSAAGYLEKNEKLMGLASKQTQVFVKLYKKNKASPEKYEVIAGGGGWGAKAKMLALSPEAKLSKGDLIEFYMLTPTDRFSKESNLASVADLSNKFTFECSYEEQSYNSSGPTEKLILESVFGCGCEKGFKYNHIKHSSAGERLTIDMYAFLLDYKMINYIKGDLFAHSTTNSSGITILAHACNCRGSWGAGVARIFKQKYPITYKYYTEHCKDHKSNPAVLLGTTLLVPITSSISNRSSENCTFVACLFTSDLTGSRKLPPYEIVKYTDKAMNNLQDQLQNFKNSDGKTEIVINMPKINAGLFNVPWHDTEEVLNKYDLNINVYVID